MASYNHIGCTDMRCALSVQAQRLDRCSSSRRQANDKATIRRPGEVLAPDMLTRIEERNIFSRITIQGRQPVRLPAIAMKTSQSQIVQGIASVPNEWDDMVYSKAHVLPLFC